MVFDNVSAKDRRLSGSAPRAPQSLPQRSYRRRRPDLCRTLHRSNINTELECRRANRRRRPIPRLQGSFRVLPDLPRQTSMMRPKLIREPLVLATPSQQVREVLHLAAAIWKQQVVGPTQRLEQVIGNRLVCPPFG